MWNPTRCRCRLLGTALACLFLVTLDGAVVSAGTFEVESRRDIRMMKCKLKASHFLHRATFGPTIEDIDALAQRISQIGTTRACREWIDHQMGLPPGLHHPLAIEMYQDDGYNGGEDGVWIQRYRWHAWWDRAIRGEDQLRQRVAWALIQILVTSQDGAGFNDRNFGANSQDPSDPDIGIPRWLGPTKYYDLMVKHAFGNYRDLLSDVTYSPVMGIYLSHLRNRKTNVNANRFPDENYAREIMQLFTIGLYELHQDGRLKLDDQGNLIPTYDNEVIKEFAKVFTGLSYIGRPGATNPFYQGNDFEYPMQMYNDHHEPGVKTLLNGQTVGSETAVDGDADIAGAIGNLMDHPNIAPFIARRLIQRLVKSNPSRAYIRRVARRFNDNGQGVKGDLKEVVKAILLDPEAWRGVSLRGRTNPNRVDVIVRGTDYSSLAEPTVRYTRFLRAMHAESDYPTGRVMGLPRDWAWIQEPYLQPTVFNFYLPDYQPPGELVQYTPSRRIPNGFLAAPEFQIKTAVTSNHLQNLYQWEIYNGYATNNAGGNQNPYLRSRLMFDYEWETSIAGTDEGLKQLIDHLDLVFCCGTIPQDFKDRMHEIITDRTAWMPGNSDWRDEYELWRVQSAIRVVVCSPFCAITQ